MCKTLPERGLNAPSFVSAMQHSVNWLCGIFQNLTFLRNISPLRIGELILTHPDPLLHAWGDGLTRVWVERRKPAQAAKRRERIVNIDGNRNVPLRIIHTQMDAILTEYTWLHPETTCHMTYHTSLAQEPLGLNEQGDTEEWRMRHTPE